MVSANISGLYCWGNQRYPLLSGALGPSPSHGGGLGRFFICPWGCCYGGPNGAANGYFSRREF
jgi:hypothetical protein